MNAMYFKFTRTYQSIACASIMLTFFSCSDFTNSAANNNSSKKRPYNITIPTGLNINEYVGRMLAYGIKEYDTTQNSEITLYFSDATFYHDTISYAVDCGSMTIGGISIVKHSDPALPGSGVDSTVSYGGPYSGINFNGTSYTFQTSGSSLFPACNLVVVSPTNPVVISSHVRNDSVSKGSSLVITWSSSNDTNNIMGISLASNSHAYQIFTDDDGSYTIPSTEMANFSTGSAVLTVARGRLNTQTVATNRYAAAAIFSAHRLQCFVVN